MLDREERARKEEAPEVESGKSLPRLSTDPSFGLFPWIEKGLLLLQVSNITFALHNPIAR